MAAFKAGGGGYGLNKTSTLRFMDVTKVMLEIWMRNLRCEVPDCNERAITLAQHGVTMLLCSKHDVAFKSDPKIALALTRAMRTWLQFHLADIARQAYEGQDDSIVLVGKPNDILVQAREILSGADKITRHNDRVNAARQSAPVIIFEVVPQSATRPTLGTLGSTNEHPGMQLFE